MSDSDLKKAPRASSNEVLGKVLKVHIADGRAIEGELQCLDKDMNMILASATEYHGLPAPSSNDGASVSAAQDAATDATTTSTNASAATSTTTSHRYLGMVMIPGKYVTQVLASNEAQ